MERRHDPLATNFVVADLSRTEKTICLAVSPSLKTYSIPGRPRLFEVVQRMQEVSGMRRGKVQGRVFSGKSWIDPEEKSNPNLKLDYIAAFPNRSSAT